jgi:toxin ParE1/3/4
VTRGVISPRAESEIENIWLSLATNDPPVAIRVTRDLGDRIDSLADYPRLGPRRRDIAPAMRILVEGAYLIVYEHYPNTDNGPSTSSTSSAYSMDDAT